MNFYDILEISNNASHEEIRKAYKKQAIKWHPDKNIDDSEMAEMKFKNIQMAYEVLSDEIKKKEYDSLTNEKQSQIYDLFKTCLKACNKQNLYENIGKNSGQSMIKLFYQDTNDFMNDIVSLNFKKIFQTIISKQWNFINETIYATIEDKYLNRYKKITVNDETVYVPLIEDEIIFAVKNHIIKIIIKCKPDTIYSLDDNYDITRIINVPLHDFLYGGSIDFDYFGNQMKYTFDSLLYDIPIRTIKNKGITIDETKTDLHLYFQISNLEKPI